MVSDVSRLNFVPHAIPFPTIQSICSSSILRLSLLQRAIPRYEAAISIMVEISDRYGQIEALSGMAKCMLATKQINKVNGGSSNYRPFVEDNIELC